MPAIVGSAHYMDALHRREGGAWTVFSILQGYPADPSTGLYPPLITWGPGATSVVPGTRLYWIDSLSGVYVTEGTVVGYVPGSPMTDTSVTIWYDRVTDALYYIRSDGSANLVADRFDGAAWTSLGQVMSAALAAGFGAIGQLPSTAVSAPSQVMVCGYGAICRWDGASWVQDFAQPNGFIAGITVAALPATGEFVVCCNCNRGVPSAGDPLIQLRSTDGVWADISPAAWQPPLQNTKRTCWCACEYNGELYAVFSNDSPTTPGASRREIWKRTAAGAWAMELDLAVELPPDGIVVSMVVIDGTLYCGMDRDYQGGDYLTKDAGGWHHNTLPADLQGAGLPSTVQTFLESPEGTIDPAEGNCSGEYAPRVRVAGFWDAQQFVAWDPATLWQQRRGVWTAPSTAAVGTQVWLGPGVQDRVAPAGNGSGGDHFCGRVDVVDPFVLTCLPSNGRSLASVSVNNTLAPGHSLLGDANYPLFLEDGYNYACPEITGVSPSSGDVNGGYTVTLEGTNFFSNLINPSDPANRTQVVNRIWVQSADGTAVEVDSRDITFVDVNHLSFPMPPFPGGTDPDVTIILKPAGLAPFNHGAPVGISAKYRCGRDSIAFSYTGLGDLAVLGSLDTVLGLGGTGGDIVAPSLADAGGGMGIPRVPDAAGCVEPEELEP